MILKFVGHGDNYGEVKEVYSDVTYYKSFMLEDSLNIKFTQAHGERDQVKEVDKVLFVMNDTGSTIDKLWGCDPAAFHEALVGKPTIMTELP